MLVDQRVGHAERLAVTAVVGPARCSGLSGGVHNTANVAVAKPECISGIVTAVVDENQRIKRIKLFFNPEAYPMTVVPVELISRGGGVQIAQRNKIGDLAQTLSA